jgi:hypothetical protein
MVLGALAVPASAAAPADMVSPMGMESQRQAITAIGDAGESAIRTHAWMLRQPPRREQLAEAPTHTPLPELYRKPDDRWEANEIADRMPEVATRLLAQLQGPTELQPLDDDLVAHSR